ncbi:MAG: hypothetical protein ABI625_00775 [bacterium]
MGPRREYAEHLVARMKALYGQPDTNVSVQEFQFPHLDLTEYHRFRHALEAVGYRYLGDHETINVSNNSTSVMARTMVRNMISADGETCAGHYQVHPRMQQVLRNLFAGVLNLRLIDAPASFLRMLKTKLVYDFVSEVGGKYVVTSNAEAAGAINAPASVDTKFFPYDTALIEVRTAHEARLTVAVARAGSEPTRMTTYADVEAMQARLKLQKAAHRAASGWITREELRIMARGNVALADEIFEEVQAIVSR